MHETEQRQGDRQRPGSPILTLAWWQLRQTWRLLLIAGAGIVVAVSLVCVAPFYEQVALSSGLHDTLNGAPLSSQITVSSIGHAIPASAMQNTNAQLQQEVQSHLQPYITKPPILTIAEQTVLLKVDGGYGGQTGYDVVDLLGEPVENAPSHAHLLAGRWPTHGFSESGSNCDGTGRRCKASACRCSDLQRFSFSAHSTRWSVPLSDQSE